MFCVIITRVACFPFSFGMPASDGKRRSNLCVKISHLVVATRTVVLRRNLRPCPVSKVRHERGSREWWPECQRVSCSVTSLTFNFFPLPLSQSFLPLLLQSILVLGWVFLPIERNLESIPNRKLPRLFSLEAAKSTWHGTEDASSPLACL